MVYHRIISPVFLLFWVHYHYMGFCSLNVLATTCLQGVNLIFSRCGSMMHSSRIPVHHLNRAYIGLVPHGIRLKYSVAILSRTKWLYVCIYCGYCKPELHLNHDSFRVAVSSHFLPDHRHLNLSKRPSLPPTTTPFSVPSFFAPCFQFFAVFDDWRSPRHKGAAPSVVFLPHNNSRRVFFSSSSQMPSTNVFAMNWMMDELDRSRWEHQSSKVLFTVLPLSTRRWSFFPL